MLLGGSQVSQLKNKNIYSLNCIPYSLYSSGASIFVPSALKIRPQTLQWIDATIWQVYRP